MKGLGKTIKRRRMEGKTDYRARIDILKSERPRVVVRKTNRYIIGQIVVSDRAQDKVVTGVSSKDLLEAGWPKEFTGSLKNLQAAYLTGYLLGKRSEIKEGILDLGLQRNIKQSRIYAFLAGLVDSGFKIPHGKESLPDEKTLGKNEKTGKLINRIKENLK